MNNPLFPRAVRMPYADPMHNAPFSGQISYYLNQWRAYMDTWPASRMTDCLGINFQRFQSYQCGAIAQLLANAGFTHARIELGWGGFDYSNPSQPAVNVLQGWTKNVSALRDSGIRPLVLLNTNSILPCPNTGFITTLTSPANVGDTSIYITPADTTKVVPGKTGLSDLSQSGYTMLAFPLITSVNSGTGQCTLSIPLRKPIAAGPLSLATLLFHPFSGPLAADGVTVNPWCEETFGGWTSYVINCCNFVKGILGNTDFDVEIFNELTFGYFFLSEAWYYASPPNQNATFRAYSNWGISTAPCNTVMDMNIYAPACDAVKANFPGVKVINGFTNTVPWGWAASMWPPTDGLSRHFYTGRRLVAPGSDPYPGVSHMNADGSNDGTLTHYPPNTWQFTAGTEFVPTLTLWCPEQAMLQSWQHNITSYITPLSPVIYDSNHGITSYDSFDAWDAPNYPLLYRNTKTRFGNTIEQWETETNCDISSFVNSVSKMSGVLSSDARVVYLTYFLKAKILLRLFVFHAHKGVKTVCAYAASDGNDWGFSIIPNSFITALGGSPTQDAVLTPQLAAQAGQPIAAIRNLSSLFNFYSDTLTSTVPLTVTSLLEYNPEIVFKGDGSAKHPDCYLGDSFFIGPFQASDSCYLIAYYPVTPNVTQQYGADSLASASYMMPDQMYEMKITGFAHPVTSLSLLDPLMNTWINEEYWGYSANTLHVKVPASDYPRIMVVRM